MTREEAIQVLTEISATLKSWSGFGEYPQAIDLAIEALSAEPCDKDAISREGLLKSWEELSPRGRTEFDQVIMTIPALPSAEPSGDIVSRADAIEAVRLESAKRGLLGRGDILDILSALPSAEAETVDCTDFIRWMTEAVMDDDMWELNAVAYGEVIARKLTKLGVLEVKDDVYVYEPSAEPKTGEWLEVEVLLEVYDIEGVKTWGSEMQCDQCGFRHTAIEGHMAQYKYCPNCGAMMLREDGEV